MSPSFLEIPDLPMGMIMNNLDFFAIQSVRKTCWDLRNFIDDKKPGIYIERIFIDETYDDSEVTLAIFPPFSMHSEDINIHLFYQNRENGCRILRAISDDGYEHKTVENLNFLDAVLHDFKIVLNSQKSIFEKVTVTSKTFFEKFKETMKSQKPIATERMDIYGESLEQGRQIMQHADPKYLKKISISMKSPRNGEYEEYPIKIYETVKFELSKNIHNFSHFATTSIQLENLDVETIRAIKENFLRLHEYDKLLSVYNNNAARENLFIDAFEAAFEPSETNGETEQNWFFHVPGNNGKVLKVLNKFRYFEYRFVEKCELSDGYVILD